MNVLTRLRGPLGAHRDRSRPSRAAWTGILFLIGAWYGSACVTATETDLTGHPRPDVTGTEPTVLVMGEVPASFEVHGLRFVDGAIASWNGSARATTFLNATTVLVTLTAEDVAATGSFDVGVSNPEPEGGASEALAVHVGYPIPTLRSVSPTSLEALAAGPFTLTARGSRFADRPPRAELLWNGLALPTTVSSDTALSATVSDYLLRRGASVAVTVRNPGPAGGVSDPIHIGVDNPEPTLATLDPTTFLVGTAGEVTLSGTGFVAGTSVSYGGTTLAPTFLSATSLTITAPPSQSEHGDTIDVHVEAPAPGGGASNALRIAILEYPPILASLSARWVPLDSLPFVLGVNGYDFAPDATVTWNGASHEATFVSPTRLTIPVRPADAEEGPVDIVVHNPRGGGASQAAVFYLLPPFVLPDAMVIAELYGGLSVLTSKLDGTMREEFPIPGGAYRLDPAPSGDGVAFIRSVVEGVDRVTRLWLVELADGIPRRLVDASFQELINEESWPRYSADGSWIYFQVRLRADGTHHAWRVRPDGTDAGPASALWDGTAMYPAPSRAGDRISHQGAGSTLHVLDLTTGTDASLGPKAKYSRWSRSDEWVAFLDLGDHMRIVRADGSDAYDAAPGYLFGPVFDWLPGDEYIVATTAAGDAVLVNVAYGKVHPLPALGQLGSVVAYPPR